MSLPFGTTTISVYAFDTMAVDPESGQNMNVDPYDEEEVTIEADDVTVEGGHAQLVFSGVPAVIGGGRGSASRDGGVRSQSTHRLDCDPCALEVSHRVVDDTTGDVYKVDWLTQRTDLDGAISHIEAGLLMVSGSAA